MSIASLFATGWFGWASSEARAEETTNGLQAAIYEPTIDFVRSQVEGQTYHFDYDDVEITTGCYDKLGIRFFNLDVPLESLNLEFQPDGTLEIDVYFDTISGTNMEVYGEDSDYLDLCPTFTSDVLYADLHNAHLSGRFQVGIDQGAVAFTWAEEPMLQGDLDTDIDWFPDDVALFFFEDTLVSAVEDSIGALVPDAVASASVDALQSGDYGDFDVVVSLDDVTVDTTKLAVAAETHIGWGGSSTCDTLDYEVVQRGRAPDLAFGDGSGSAFAVGLTEAMTNELLQVAWRDGFFCFDEEAMAQYLDSVKSEFDASVGQLSGAASIAEPATVTIEPDGIHLDLTGFHLDVSSGFDGGAEPLLELRADIGMVLDLEVDQSLTAFTASVHDLDLKVNSLSANHLLSADREEAAAHLVAFLEGWVTEWAEAHLQDITLYASQYNLYGVVLKVDELAYESGGLKLYGSIYDQDDPAVDDDAPETAIEVVGSRGNTVQVDLVGDDARSPSLAYSWKLDDGSWSSWSTEERVELEGLEDGPHELLGRSRDGWLNIDASPASLRFEMSGGQLQDATGGEEAHGACACAAAGARGEGGTALLGVVVALAAHRRRRSGGPQKA